MNKQGAAHNRKNVMLRISQKLEVIRWLGSDLMTLNQQVKEIS
jgi:hypothetical protein